MAEKGARPKSFKIEIPGNDTMRQSIREKMLKVRDFLVKETERPVNNAMILENILDFWNNRHLEEDRTGQIPTYHAVEKDSASQELYVISKDALQKALEIGEHHGSLCNAGLSIVETQYLGHAVKTKFRCRRRHGHHMYNWFSSSRLPNQELLVNARMAHGYFCSSGILPVMYQHFMDTCGIGHLSEAKRTEFQNEYFFPSSEGEMEMEYP
jgi:hypothetical protein